MTVDDVATLLKVRRSWIYERTRTRNNGSRKDMLPFVKVGKNVRFDPAAVAEFIARCSRQDRTR
jgi:excisionase family DNA binding protein